MHSFFSCYIIISKTAKSSSKKLLLHTSWAEQMIECFLFSVTCTNYSLLLHTHIFFHRGLLKIFLAGHCFYIWPFIISLCLWSVSFIVKSKNGCKHSLQLHSYFFFSIRFSAAQLLFFFFYHFYSCSFFIYLFVY